MSKISYEIVFSVICLGLSIYFSISARNQWNSKPSSDSNQIFIPWEVPCAFAILFGFFSVSVAVKELKVIIPNKLKNSNVILTRAGAKTGQYKK